MPPCSFVDRDMLMRHFGHGVGHLQYDRQQEIVTQMTVGSDDDHDSLADMEAQEIADEESWGGEQDCDIAVDLEESQKSDGEMVVDGCDSEANSEVIGMSDDSDSDSDDAGYASP